MEGDSEPLGKSQLDMHKSRLDSTEDIPMSSTNGHQSEVLSTLQDQLQERVGSNLDT